jgi:adenylosuccinate lyase
MSLTSISPIDGRYANKTKELKGYFSEHALIKYRVFVEIEYFKFLAKSGIKQLYLTEEEVKILDAIVENFNKTASERVKSIEQVTNHDVKAVEYYIKEQIDHTSIEKYKEFIHFGLTSQDINNTSFPLMIKDAISNVIFPALESLNAELESKALEYEGIAMLAKTHGQPASPTSLGKEFLVFTNRLQQQFKELSALSHRAKFGGATGNLNAHKVTFPHIDWRIFANNFVKNLGLEREKYTTQIAHYDEFASFAHLFIRINNILIDFCRDIWTYISMEYFKQKVIANEVGSSAMPHKVNPIDFENAEGNLGIANAMLQHMANKLPISRLQRDLTDSTVLRNIGVPFSHMIIAFKSIDKGLSKLLLNEEKLIEDLNQNWAVVAEAIQNILRREGYDKPYEALKSLTRGAQTINKERIMVFIDSLNVSDEIKQELKAISPLNYTGYTK